MSTLETEFLFEIDAELREPNLMIGAVPEGSRMIAHVEGGTFKGPRIKGTMPASGGDWVLARADGSIKIDVRAALTTDDGHNIYTYYGGRIVMTPEQMGALGDRAAAEALDPSTYYFRTNPLFEAAMDGPYAWLNHVVAVGIGRLTAKGVAYKVYALK
ncbi:hypothetical protein RHODOSMS8_03775 [Rhodobiaceae bacterium]|nr:hypothetical protein RHODOSMS8_03775 [Rhodobiaceae bacterium]